MFDLAKLREPFPYNDIEWRVAQAGKGNNGIWAKVLAYITARAIMDRLDDVVGPGNWKIEYREIRGALGCGISILIERSDGTWEWVTKWDGTGKLETSDGLSESDAGKGDFSNAQKRAGYQWGIGRYLYDLTEDWAVISESGNHFGKTKGGETFRWNPPQLPAWALPAGSTQPKSEAREMGNGNGGSQSQNGNGSASRPQDGQKKTHTNSQGSTVAGGASTKLPTCPNCDGPCWDNRQKKASGQFKPEAPDFACKNKDCGGKIWPDQELTSADMAAELDRQARVVELMIRDLSGLNAERSDAAKAAYDELLRTENVTLEMIRRLGGQVKTALDQENAAVATALAAIGAGEDDDLPF